jgi:hypothetical protein
MVGSKTDTGVSFSIWYELYDRLASLSRSVQFYGAIPGGQSFQLNQGTLTTVNGANYGFSWIVPVRAGSTVLLVGGDSRGIGSAGWTQQNVNQEGNNTCLDSSSPSSTPGSPAGGAYPTGTSPAGGSYPTSSNGVGTSPAGGAFPTSSGTGGGSGSGGNTSSR